MFSIQIHARTDHVSSLFLLLESNSSCRRPFLPISVVDERRGGGEVIEAVLTYMLDIYTLRAELTELIIYYNSLASRYLLLTGVKASKGRPGRVPLASFI